MKDIICLYDIKNIFCYLERKINLNILKTQFCFDRAFSGQRSPQCTIAQYYSTIVEWCIYFISCDPVSSNQMTRIYIGII